VRVSVKVGVAGRLVRVRVSVMVRIRVGVG